MIALETLCIKTPGMSKLAVHIYYQTASGARLALEHEVQRQLPGELDQAVIAGFGDDEDGLNVRLDASSTKLLAHIAHSDGGFCETFGEPISECVFVVELSVEIGHDPVAEIL